MAAFWTGGITILFSSNIFLFLFLPLTLLGYFLLKKEFRNVFLLLMSLIFYGWGEPKFVFIMVGSIIFNYVMALIIDKLNRFQIYKRTALLICIIGNLSLLFIYKYLDFFIININRFGIDFPLKNLALPLGISFFTFQAMSYVIDVYRGDVKVQKKLHNVGLYISLFPQLIAGPIVRYKDVEEQIYKREESFEKFNEGVERFIIGFSKKILLANNMAIIADKAFAFPDAKRSIFFAWLGVIAYSFQILFDFSGYSDMAIGLGKMFGFEFLENFNYPYISKSISEFWRRWHMSLGNWFRDYIYFPLGGSRVNKKSRLVFNLFIVWLLTGIWHGAAWNFIVWGLFYFLFIAFEKLSGFPNKFKSKISIVLYRIFTLLAVLGGWVLFRATGLNKAIKYGLSMLGYYRSSLYCAYSLFLLKEFWFFLIVSILVSLGFFSKESKMRIIVKSKLPTVFSELFLTFFYLFCFVWSVSFIILGSHNPFIYFNF